MHVHCRRPEVANRTIRLTLGNPHGFAKLQKEHSNGHREPKLRLLFCFKPRSLLQVSCGVKCWVFTQLTEGESMKKLIAFFLALASIPFAAAAENIKEVDRLKDAGTVLKEILNIP